MTSTVPLRLRLRRFALAVAGTGVALGLLWAGALPCVFARVLHVPCPGCGSTRSVLALAHGDLAGVLRFNPFGPVVAVLFGVLGLQGLASVARHGDLRGVGVGRVGLLVKRMLFVVALLDVTLWAMRFFGVLGGPVPV